jgi:RimJ/RimL family protein N-acetyltransferase
VALGGIIKGKTATLRTPVEADLAAYNRWMADMRVRHLIRAWHQPAMPATWKERLKEQTKDKDSVLWSIEADGALVGLVRFAFGWNDHNFGWVDQLIIDPDSWRRGHGADAALALHRYLFDYLDLRRVNVTIRSDATGAIAIARRLGYVEFARGHEVHFRDGGYSDELWMLVERAAWDERFPSEREYALMSGGRGPRSADRREA